MSELTTALTAEKAAMERVERERATHKKAARCFFDALGELFPPDDAPEYWERVTNRVCEVYRDAGKPPLLKHLLAAMVEYLEEFLKDGMTKERR